MKLKRYLTMCIEMQMIGNRRKVLLENRELYFHVLRNLGLFIKILKILNKITGK